jgi:hypothetical protein
VTEALPLAEPPDDKEDGKERAQTEHQTRPVLLREQCAHSVQCGCQHRVRGPCFSLWALWKCQSGEIRKYSRRQGA